MSSSMTGFGRGESSNDQFDVTVEIKSVNHRFKDIRFKMSSIFSSLELSLKEKLLRVCSRGSFDIYINFKKIKLDNSFDGLDHKKINDFLETMIPLFESKKISPSFNPSDFLRKEFYKESDLAKDDEFDSLVDLVQSSFDQALIALSLSRKEEGHKLLGVLRNHRDEYLECFKIVEENAVHFQKIIEDRLRKKFQELSSEVEIDEPRFLQEVVYYLEKMDIHEELNRVKFHISKMNDLLDNSKEIGRQIDFLVQELNRETNTIGSKSSTDDISNAIVQMKVHLEKIREQGLNLE